LDGDEDWNDGKDDDQIGVEELLDDFDSYKLQHGFEWGVLLQSATEAKSLLMQLLSQGVISAEEAAESACYDCAWLSLTALSTVTCNLWL
jgi:hypothetical protein